MASIVDQVKVGLNISKYESVAANKTYPAQQDDEAARPIHRIEAFETQTDWVAVSGIHVVLRRKVKPQIHAFAQRRKAELSLYVCQIDLCIFNRNTLDSVTCWSDEIGPGSVEVMQKNRFVKKPHPIVEKVHVRF